MRNVTYKLIALTIVVLLAVALPMAALAQGGDYPNVVLWDNGPLVNVPGGGPGGADASLVRDLTVGLTSRGYNISASGGFRASDNFTITQTGGWQIDTIDFYPYMGGMTSTTPPITALNYQIWNGPPDDPLSTVVFGDTTTNRMTSVVWSNAYRYKESDPAPGDTTRPLMHVVASAGTTLPAGTYWLDWQVDGDISYTGPWQPNITIDGQTITGNAKQFDGTSWIDAIDTGLSTPQGFPFTLNGTVVNPSAVDVSGVQARTAPSALWVAAAVFGLVLAGALVARRARS